MSNPITREDKRYLAQHEEFMLLGKILAYASVKNDAGLQDCKRQVNEMRGIRTVSPDDAAAIAAAGLKKGSLTTSDVLSIYSAPRATQKTFRATLTGKATTA